MSKPRVFVSSTYYDLKYVRERIEHLINAYCLEPILFEKDSVYFHPNTSLDVSCYNEVKNCHMMLLIVGGRYGSLATTREDYEAQQVSITRKEYETARKKGIPVMIFVDQNVYAEYKTYQMNSRSLPKGFKFAFVDDVKVFEFISALEGSGAIKTFDKIDDIEHYFAYQISGMLLAYLQQLQNNKVATDMQTAVDEINVISKSVQRMVNSIAEKLLEGEYGKLLEQQNCTLIDFYIEEVAQRNIEVQNVRNVLEKPLPDLATTICDMLMDTVFNFNRLSEVEKHPFEDYFEIVETIRFDFENLLQTYCDSTSCQITVNVKLLLMWKRTWQIVTLMHDSSSLVSHFKTRLIELLIFKLNFTYNTVA